MPNKGLVEISPDICLCDLGTRMVQSTASVEEMYRDLRNVPESPTLHEGA